MKRIPIIFLFLLPLALRSQDNAWSRVLAQRAMQLWPDSITQRADRPVRWSYEQGVLLSGIEAIWENTGDGVCFTYLKKIMDHLVESDGSIRTYREDDFNLDNLCNGQILIDLYEVTGDKRYFKAASLLRDQIRHQPRTRSGGFWHKKVYPFQMWLDGLYMAEPFYADYARLANDDTAWNDIARQFILMEQEARDSKTGLLYHGWDESRAQQWANKITGSSSQFWARAMGWYGMALVDVLDKFPAAHPHRKELLAILQRYAKAVTAVQDPGNGLWWDVLNQPGRQGNYPEASASSMFVYTLAKASRKGWLPATYRQVALKGYQGLLSRFILKNADGSFDFTGTVSVSGLGGKPYRDGSYNYYVSEPVQTNDPKGMGAFLKAACEMERIPLWEKGRGITVTLDNYFNHETRVNAAGVQEVFHYTWNDRANSGFSTLGHLFLARGARLKMLAEKPGAASLAGSQVYIIVDPDTRKESPDPHYIQPEDVKIIADWVKKGGLLLLMANDSANVELKHFNLLAETFGIHWSDTATNFVKGNAYETGAVTVDPGNPVFPSVKKVYMKEVCLLLTQPGVTTLLTKPGQTLMAMRAWGRGLVLAVGDPWLYNEYTDGRKLPGEYQNFAAATDLVNYLLRSARQRMKQPLKGGKNDKK